MKKVSFILSCLFLVTVFFSCSNPNCDMWNDETRCVGNIVESCESNYWKVSEDCSSRGLLCTTIDEAGSCESKDMAEPELAVCGEENIFSLTSLNDYPSFYSGDTVISSEGFGIYYNKYYETTEGQVEWSKDDDKVVSFSYNVEGGGMYTNWISFRYQFSLEPLSGAGCAGIEFDVRADDISGADLRFTLADVEFLGDFYSEIYFDDIYERLRWDGYDELWWWNDEETDILSTASEDWYHFHIPFSNFEESYGAGTRHNNHKLDLPYIAAIEFSVIGYNSIGRFSIKNVKTYSNLNADTEIEDTENQDAGN